MLSHMARLISTSVLLGVILPATANTPNTYHIADVIFNISGSSDFNKDHIEPKKMRWYSELQNDGIPMYTSDHYYTNSFRIFKYQSADSLFTMKLGRLTELPCNSNNLGEKGLYLGCDLESIGLSGDSDISNLNVISSGTVFGNQIYTPSDFEQTSDGKKVNKDNAIIQPQLYDRPFSAWIYLGNYIDIQNTEYFQRHTFTYGLVGESAYGQDLQEYAHKHPFSGAEYIPGWQTQVSDRLALQYTGVLGYKPFASKSMSVYSKFEYGSILQRASIGINASYKFKEGPKCYNTATVIVGAGADIPKLYDSVLIAKNAQIQSLQAANKIKVTHKELKERGIFEDGDKYLVNLNFCSPTDSSILVFGSAEATYVHSNYLIENGIHVPAIEDAPVPISPAASQNYVIDKKAEELFYTTRAGVTFKYGDRVSVSISSSWRTSEVKDQHRDTHRWGTLAFDYKIDSLLGFFVLPGLVYSIGKYNDLK